MLQFGEAGLRLRIWQDDRLRFEFWGLREFWGKLQLWGPSGMLDLKFKPKSMEIQERQMLDFERSV